ncbi:hypothetical protein NLG42_19265 [Flavobacterium plurextorum]|nr:MULTISPECIES: hypothetical protein [Flavobacterium]UUW08236.1 hypothetical protein NLG42_19265 [Flavobacterium plurextorum]
MTTCIVEAHSSASNTTIVTLSEVEAPLQLGLGEMIFEIMKRIEKKEFAK